MNKTHLKSDARDGSIVDGLRQPILFSFVLNKPSGFKMSRELETIHFKKINKSLLNTIRLSLEDDNHKKNTFNGKMLTFTLQIIKI